MLEYFIEFLRQLPTAGVLVFVCFITFLENVFPPSPSDMVLVFCGTLIGISGIGFVPMVISATLGSVMGFAAMYAVGLRFGDRIKHRNSPFLPREAIERADVWFQKYGLLIIIANRFLSGTRAVISLFAGMAKLTFVPTMLLSAASAALWNAILLGAGALLGNNWEKIDGYLALYGRFALGAVVLVLVGVAARFLLQARKANASDNTVKNTAINATNDVSNNALNDALNNDTPSTVTTGTVAASSVAERASH
jgi:membrane protein DedA with SNARE-associated domain